MILVALAGLIFGSAGPAAAATVVAGAGTGGGYEAGDFTNPHGGDDPACDLPQEGAYGHSRFVLTHASSYEGVQDQPPAAGTATGVTEMDIVTDHHYAAPHGVSEQCTQGLLVPGPVDIKQVDIRTVIPVAGSVTCAGGSNAANSDIGDYYRVNTTIVMTFTVKCTIAFGPLGPTVIDEDVTHYVEGQMVTCGLDPVPTTNQTVWNPACTALNPNATSLVESTFEAHS